MKVLYIIRGLPGSGKSTLAKKLVEENRHKEADMYHINKATGRYYFNPCLIKKSHEWCLREISDLMDSSNDDCAVSNTFTRFWEYENYINVANEIGFTVQVIECHAEFENTHDVPISVIEEMKNRFEPHGK